MRVWCAAAYGAQTTLDQRQMKDGIPNSYYGGHAFDPPVYMIYDHPTAMGERKMVSAQFRQHIKKNHSEHEYPSRSVRF